MGLFDAVVTGASALLGAGASIYGASQQSKAANRAIDEQRRQYNLTRKDLQPYLDVGKLALSDLSDIYITGKKPYTASPGYDFRYQEGIKARERAAAARGNQLSGAQLKALTRYGQDYATADYDNQFQRLSTLGGFGQNAVNTSGQVGQNVAVNIGNAGMNAAQARTSGFEGVASSFNDALNNYYALRGLGFIT